MIRNCSHGYAAVGNGPGGGCPVEGCPNNDARTPLLKCFGRNPNSVFAAELFRTNKLLYEELRRQAVEQNLLPASPQFRSLLSPEEWEKRGR